MILREEMARELCKADGWLWDLLDELPKHYYTAKYRSDYYKEADMVIALFRKAVERIENPHDEDSKEDDEMHQALGFNEAIQAVLDLVPEEEK